MNEWKKNSRFFPFQYVKLERKRDYDNKTKICFKNIEIQTLVK